MIFRGIWGRFHHEHQRYCCLLEAILALASGSVAGVAKAFEFGLSKLIVLVIGLFAKLIGLGDLAKRVQKIFKKIRKRVDKVVRDLFKKAKRAGRKLMRKLGLGSKEKPKNKEQHDEQVKAGLQYLDQLSNKEDKDNNKALTEEEAKKVASKTKKKFHVFTSITPRNEGGKWVYDWTGSKGIKKTDEKVDGEFKRGDHVFNLGLGKALNQMGETSAGKIQSLSTILKNGATTLDGDEFHLTVTKKGEKQNAGDENAKMFGVLNQRIIKRFSEIVEVKEAGHGINPTALDSLFESLFTNSIDTDAISYLSSDNLKKYKLGKEKLLKVKENILDEIKKIEKEEEKNANDDKINAGKEVIRNTIRQTQARLDQDFVNKDKRIFELNASDPGSRELSALKAKNFDGKQLALDDARARLMIIENMKISDSDDRELVLLEIQDLKEAVLAIYNE